MAIRKITEGGQDKVEETKDRPAAISKYTAAELAAIRIRLIGRLAEIDEMINLLK